MRTLLLHDSTPDQAVADTLVAAGHDVVRCWDPGQPGFPCKGSHGACPLDGSVEVAVVVHERLSNLLALGELGMICALRDGIPVVVTGRHAGSVFAERADAIASDTEDVPDACQRAVVAADRRASARVSRACGAEAEVSRRGHAIRVVLAPGSSERDAVSAHQAATRLFPAARTIDVAVQRRTA
jgi:hypothetical protein